MLAEIEDPNNRLDHHSNRVSRRVQNCMNALRRLSINKLVRLRRARHAASTLPTKHTHAIGGGKLVFGYKLMCAMD